MRWPWQKAERRGYTDRILQSIYQHATEVAADAGKSSAMESGAGFVARALAAAEVVGPEWARRMLPPLALAQIGRGLIRRGVSIWAIGEDEVFEAGYWNFQQGAVSRDSWRCRVTLNGPHDTIDRVLPFERILFFEWGHHPAIPWAPSGPLQFASTAGELASNTERALAHESATPVSAIVEVPADGWADNELAGVKAKIKNAAGRLFFADAMKTGDRLTDPDSSWRQKHIGPMPVGELVELGRDAYQRALGAMGLPPDLFQHGANAQGQKEAARRAFLNVVVPLGKVIERELQDKLDSRIRLKHDRYFADAVGRAQVVEKLTAAGVPLNVALSAVEIVDD